MLGVVVVVAAVTEPLGGQRYRVVADFIEERCSTSLVCFDPPEVAARPGGSPPRRCFTGGCVTRCG